MAASVLSRRWLLAWLIVLAYMAAAAWYARDRSLASLSSQLTEQLRAYAEEGIGNPPFTYPRNDYVSDCQGPMVYLIERGYRDPQMLRVMLLCEARRCYDRIYLYDRCLNWDLRTHLIEECLGAFPDDPLVHWAAGRCLLTGGEYSVAADELLAAEMLGFDPQPAGVRPMYFAGRIETALLMAGRVDEVVERSQAEVTAAPQAHGARYFYAELLTKLGRYGESNAVVSAWRDALGEWPKQDVLYMRNAWWSCSLADFERHAEINASRREEFLAEYADEMLMLDWASIRLALLKGDYQLAETLAGDRCEMLMRALAETYAFTGEIDVLEDLEDKLNQAARLDEEIGTDYSRPWDERRAANQRLGIAEANLLRAYMLRSQWKAVAARLKAPVWVGYAPAIESTYEFALLVASLTEGYEWEKPWRWYEYRSEVPWLLYSDVFREAAVAGGYDTEAARRMVLAELAVERGTYHDCSNGELDW